MNPSDEAELHRLCTQLERIDLDSTRSDQEREALKKAALALHVVFTRNLRSDIERQYASIGQPLTEAQQKHFGSLDMDPDTTRPI